MADHDCCQLQSSAVAYKYGISGPWWYGAGATVQVLLFAQVCTSAVTKTGQSRFLMYPLPSVACGKIENECASRTYVAGNCSRALGDGCPLGLYVLRVSLLSDMGDRRSFLCSHAVMPKVGDQYYCVVHAHLGWISHRDELDGYEYYRGELSARGDCGRELIGTPAGVFPDPPRSCHLRRCWWYAGHATL